MEGPRTAHLLCYALTAAPGHDDAAPGHEADAAVAALMVQLAGRRNAHKLEWGRPITLALECSQALA